MRDALMETRVVSLYVHGDRPTRREDTEPTPMLAMPRVEAVEDLGLRQDRRYFRPGDPGRERKRQVSLIDEGTIRRLEQQFGPIDRSLIKAQIVLEGDVFLPGMLGSTLRFEGGAELALTIARRPCYAMDLIKSGLREAMEEDQQGALASVTRTGTIAVGNAVRILHLAPVRDGATA